MDLISEETLSNVTSSTISTTSDIVQSDGDNIKIAYFLPAMGGFTAGISHADSGATTGTDTTTYGAQYTMEAGGNTVTIGGASASTEVSGDIYKSTQNMGFKVFSVNLRVIVSKGTTKRLMRIEIHKVLLYLTKWLTELH
jgi:hypothetical protein